MPITHDGTTYVVGKANGSVVNLPFGAGLWRIFKRRVGETDAQLQTRIGEAFDEHRRAAASTPPSSPANPRSAPSSGSKRPKDKLSPQSAANSMPPPPAKRPSTTRGGKLVEAATGMPMEQLLRAERQAAAASGSALEQPPESQMVRRLEKKIREIERLQQQESDGRQLSAEEHAKVAQLAAI